jgi:uncharacterized RDD family membrane protein YckC
MKCPTCGYIGFETSERCRNCGYEFALATPTEPTPELALQGDDDGGPLREIEMGPESRPPRATTPETQPKPDLERVLQNLDRVFGGPEPASSDLPLFEQSEEDMAPLVSPSASPRRPLSVRRATPDPARLRARTPRPRMDPGFQSLELPLPDRDDPTRRRTVPRSETLRDGGSAEPYGAPPVRRALSALMDLVIVGGIDLLVVSLTLRLLGLTAADLHLLPLVPLLVFFVLTNGGYLATFTAAGGQTIGKMAFGLRVVGHADLPVSAGLSIVRAAGCLVTLVSFGLGFVPALLHEGGRALEDHLADTRVVRVSAA